MDPKVYLPLLKTFEDLGVEDGGNGVGGLIGQRVLAGRGSEGNGREGSGSEGSGMGTSIIAKNESLSPMQGVQNNQLSHPPDHQISWQHAHMRYAVNVHLKRWELAIDWCVRLIQCVYRHSLLESTTITTTATTTTTTTTTSSQSTSSQSISSMISTVQSVALTTSQLITEQACHPSALSKLNAMMMELSSYTLNTTTNTSTTINNNTLLGGVSGIPSSSSGSGSGTGSNNGTNAISQIYLIAHNLLSKVRVSYGMHCMKRRQYGEASAAFLTTTPPMVMEGE